MLKYTRQFLDTCGFKQSPENVPWTVSAIQTIDHIHEAIKPGILYVFAGPVSTGDLESLSAPVHLLLLAKDIQEAAINGISQKHHVHFLYSPKQEIPEDFPEQLDRAYERDQRLCAFTAMLSEALFGEATIQEMTDLAFLSIGNPVFVFNAAFKLIAANKFSPNMDEHSLEIINEGGFTQYDFDFVNHYFYQQRPLHEQVKRSPVPVLVTDEKLGRQRLILCFDPQKDIGHLVISDFHKPIDAIDYDYLVILRNFIYERLQQSEFIKNTMGFPYEFFLSDLLDKKITSQKALLSRFSYVHQEFADDLYCLVVETARSFHTVNLHRVRNDMESLFPALKTLLYQGQIVGVLSHKKEKCLTSSDYNALHQFCAQQGLFCGISNTFENIFSLPDYYKQALRAIELGVCHANEPGLFIYQNYYMEHIAHLFKINESAQVFCDPHLKRLMDYDNKNETEYAYTLYVYLLHERNITLTAARLFVHRNTLVYRMKKIASLVAYDTLTARERLYYILSYELIHN